MARENRYSIGEVVELVGITRRTIHFYVQIGLLARPHGGGRGHYYTDEHLLRLGLIKDLQSQGLSLSDIGSRINGYSIATEGNSKCSGLFHGDRQSRHTGIAVSAKRPSPTMWTHVEVIDGIELHVRGGVRQMTPARLEKVCQAIRQALEATDEARPIAGKEHKHADHPEEE